MCCGGRPGMTSKASSLGRTYYLFGVFLKNKYSTLFLFLLISAGLHVLVFLLWPTTQQATVSTSYQSSIQLTLVQVTHKKEPEKNKPKKTKEPTTKKTTPTKIKNKPEALTKKQVAIQKTVPEPVHEAIQPKKSSGHQVVTLVENKQLLSERIQKQLNLKIHFTRSYPRLAIRNAWEGQVNLGIRVLSDGQLTGVHVINSSGYRILDNAAMKSVNKVAHLPEARFWLGGKHIDVVLPIVYKLTDS